MAREDADRILAASEKYSTRGKEKAARQTAGMRAAGSKRAAIRSIRTSEPMPQTIDRARPASGGARGPVSQSQKVFSGWLLSCRMVRISHQATD